MSGGSLAFQQYQKLQVNQARQLEQMRGRLTELGDDYGLQQLDTMMAEFGATGPASPDDPIGAFLTELVQQTKDALADLGTSRATLAGVWAVALKRDVFSARMTRFTDGSALVAVSDSTFSLCQLYAQAMGLAGQLGPEPQVLAGLLRYYNTQQRIFGIAGKLEIRLEPAATLTPSSPLWPPPTSRKGGQQKRIFPRPSQPGGDPQPHGSLPPWNRSPPAHTAHPEAVPLPAAPPGRRQTLSLPTPHPTSRTPAT
ncbi:hypothetical protein [Streptomyces chartreusis]|uniref:hypothetical protein n=1 Tax=Streptomyces chartreusis TaxID=1969 RepID=UPI002E194207